MSVFDSIYLTGFRASGKTTLGLAISRQSGLVFLDTDHKLQEEAGMSIESIVFSHGWDYFRDLEENILKQTVLSTGLVVATGGGIVLRQSSRDILKNARFLTVYLKADPDLILRRLNHDPNPGQRPSLSQASMEDEVIENLTRREPLYQECADMVLDAGEPAGVLAVRVMEKLSVSV